MDEPGTEFRRSVGMDINDSDPLITGGLTSSNQAVRNGIPNFINLKLTTQNPVQTQTSGGVLFINPTTATTIPTSSIQGVLPSTLYIRPIAPMDEMTLPIHNCQLCKKKFVNPQNLLSHMKSFHLIDTNHILEAKSARDTIKAAQFSQSSSPIQVQIPASVQKPSSATSTSTTTDTTTSSSSINMPVSFIQPMYNIIRPPEKRYIPVLPAPTGPTKNSTLLNTTSATTTNSSRSSSNAANIPVSLSSLRNISSSSIAKTNTINSNPIMTTPKITSVVSNASKNLIQTTNTEERIPVITSTISKATTSEIKVEDDDEVECILPQSPVGNEADAETDVLDEGGKDSPVFLQILEQQQQKASRKQNLSQFSSSNVQRIINLEPYMAKNGNLTEQQISFAATMLEPYYESEEDKLEGRRPEGYRCVICGQIVMNTANAKLHVRHIHLGELYKCGFCGRQFEKKTTRDRHRTHCSRNSNVKSNGGNKNTVTIIQSQIYVNHGGPVTTATTTTTNTEEIGIHPSQLGNHINRTIGRYGDRFECIKCRKKFSAQKYAASHVRLVHFGSHHRCSFCGLIFENNIHLHREKCQKSNVGAVINGQGDKEAEVIPSENTSAFMKDDEEEDENAEEIQHLNSIMKESVICIKKKGTVPNSFKQVFQCKLCEHDFDKRPNAEAHIWIEHIRNQWAATCGNKNVDGIYLQFLKAQFTNSSSIAAATAASSSSSSSKVDNSSSINKSSYVYAGSIDNVTYTETEEEIPFDPMAFCNNQIFVEESSSFSHEGHVEDEGLNNTTTTTTSAYNLNLNKSKTIGEISHSKDSNNKDSDVQCKLEVEDESYCDANINGSGDNSDNDDVPQFKIVGYESTANAPTNSESQGSKELTEKEINELNMKALRFIKEKSGQFYCIVCQRVSSLRRRLVDHVRLVHLLGGVEENERDTTNITDRGKRSHSPDPHNRLYCCYCEDYFHSMGARIRHEGSCPSMGNKVQEPNIHLAGGTSYPPPSSSSNIKTSSTSEERALRFVRLENNEFSCTICKIRSTKADRLINHVRRTHFGEALDCRGCKKTFPDETTKNRHMIRCSLFKRLQESNKNKKVGSKDASTKLGPKSNIVIDRNGVVRKKPGRPFRNLVMTDTTTSQSALQMGKVIDMTSVETRAKTVSSKTPSLRSSSSTTSSDTYKKSQTSTTIKNKQDSDKIENKKQSLSSAPTTTKIKPTSSSGTSATTTATTSQKKLTTEQIQQAKDMIIPWRVGGLYAFSKCKECSTLFSKYSNAEIHVRNVHILGEKSTKSQESKKDTSTADTTNHQNLKRPVRNLGSSSENIPTKTTKYNEEEIDQVNLDEDHDDDDDKMHSNNNSDEEWDGGDDNRILTDDEEDSDEISHAVTSPKKPKSLAVDVRKKYKNFRERLHHCQNCNTQIFGDTQFQSHKKTCIGKTTITTNNSKNPPSNVDSENFQDLKLDVLTPALIKEALSHLEKLKPHRTGNKVIERYKCKICNITLRGLANECGRHVRIVHYGERRHQCKKCGNRFAYRQPYLNHEYNCDGISKPIENSKKTKEEEEENDDVIPISSSGSFSVREVFRCKICEETYIDKSLCLYHLTSHVEALKSLGKPGQDLDAMESLIDHVTSKAKCYINTPSAKFVETTKSATIKDESSTDHKSLSKSSQPSQLSKKATSTTQQQQHEKEQMPVIMDTYSVGDHKPSSKTTKTNKKVNTVQKFKPIKVYSSSSAFLKETSTELGYYLYDGKLQPLIPSYVQLGKKLDQVGDYIKIGKSHHKKVGGGTNIQKKNQSVSQQRSSTNPTTMVNETKPKLPISTSSSRCFSTGVSEFVQIDWPVSETGVLTDEEISKAHALIYETQEIGDQPEIQKMYRCMACPAHDKSIDKMQQHAREQHFGELPFACANEECDKRFQKSLAMKLHSRICCAKNDYGEIPDHMKPRKKFKRKKGLNLIKKCKGSKKKLSDTFKAKIYSTSGDEDTEEQKDNDSDFKKQDDDDDDQGNGNKNTKQFSAAPTTVRNVKVEQLESS